MPPEQPPSLSGDFSGRSCVLATHPEQVEQMRRQAYQDTQRAERMLRLRALLADHSGFMRDRLESFVGRQKELVEIHQRIVQQIRTGGYVTITGQAGQGK